MALTSLESSEMYSGLARLVGRGTLGFHCDAAAAALRLGTARSTRDGTGASKSSASANKSPYLNNRVSRLFSIEYNDIQPIKDFIVNLLCLERI